MKNQKRTEFSRNQSEVMKKWYLGTRNSSRQGKGFAAVDDNSTFCHHWILPGLHLGLIIGFVKGVHTLHIIPF